MKKFKVLLALLFTISFCLPQASMACVGKTIVIGSKDESKTQRMVGEIIAMLIQERTGTSVKLVSYKNAAECRKAILDADIDIYVEYVGSALTEVLKIDNITDEKKAFKTVKDQYKEKFNLVWLASYGFDNPEGLLSKYQGKGIPTAAAPVVRKDTLKKFPALHRLLKKLTGKITNKTLDGLIKKLDGDNYKKIARNFLRSNRLI